MIKYNSNVIDKCNFSTSDVNEMWYNGKMCYKYFKADGEPTPPTPPSFDGKFKAEYSDGTSYSAACDGDTTLASGDTKPRGYQYTAMTSAIIGDNCVTSIGKEVFSDCSNLTSCTIPNSVTIISSSAFASCDSLTSIGLVGSGASVEIPNTVTSIENSAFIFCKGLTSIDIPDSVTSIGTYAFGGCSGLTSCTIGSGVASIGEVAFNDCSSLTSIDIPDSVTEIGRSAFASCDSLTSITIPSSVTSIGDTAFHACSGLTSVTIGSGITSIGSSAFANCRGLRSVTCNAVNPPTLIEGWIGVFGNTNNCPIYVPDGSVNSYKSSWTSYASRIKPISEKPE